MHAKTSECYAIGELCRLFGVTKQSYYQFDEEAAMAKGAREDIALQYIMEIREQDPGMGSQKLWYIYKREFSCEKTLGRDSFYRLIAENCLQVRRSTSKPRTTDSTHSLPTYPNLVKELIPTRPNQLWVSDITYIEIKAGKGSHYFCYLSLILDAYTEEIIGWKVGATLETYYPLEALKMALHRLEGREANNLIHHSDRGCQYASSDYIYALSAAGIRPSMTENGNPKDNAQAERVNNTIKNELLRGKEFRNIEQVNEALMAAITFYNTRRPHMSLGMMTPVEAALTSGPRDMKWRSFRHDAILKNRAENAVAGVTSNGAPSGDEWRP